MVGVKVPVSIVKLAKLPIIETVTAFPAAGVPVIVPLIKFPLLMLVTVGGSMPSAWLRTGSAAIANASKAEQLSFLKFHFIFLSPCQR
jgi:hypothetical protein